MEWGGLTCSDKRENVLIDKCQARSLHEAEYKYWNLDFWLHDR